MQMPSLVKYFAFVGGALLALLSFANYLLDPSTGATPVAAVQPKRTITVQHDPRASKVERWRDDQAALKAQQEKAPREAQAQAPVPPLAAVASTEPVTQQAKSTSPEPKLAAVEPVPQPTVDPAPLATSTASLTPVAQPAADAPDAAQIEKAAAAEKAKARAEARKAHRKQVARARERQRLAQEGGWNNSNKQDEYYYGQRPAYGPGNSPAYAYAPPPPRPAYGPFGGGWNRSW
jgi:hypothetical protein